MKLIGLIGKEAERKEESEREGVSRGWEVKEKREERKRMASELHRKEIQTSFTKSRKKLLIFFSADITITLGEHHL